METETRIDYWKRLIRSHTAGATDDQIERGAALCLETEQAGNPCGVWHAMATVCNRPCWCAKCRPDVKGATVNKLLRAKAEGAK